LPLGRLGRRIADGGLVHFAGIRRSIVRRSSCRRSSALDALLARSSVLKPTIVAALGAACLAGCGGPTDSNVAAAAGPAVSYARLEPGSKAKPSNEYSRQLFDMNDQIRLATFRKFMTESDERCDLVTGAVLKGGYRHVDMWRVACSDSGEWMISIDPDSSTKILSCDTMKRLGDDCHSVWKP
jgi:hypothetical protein